MEQETRILRQSSCTENAYVKRNRTVRRLWRLHQTRQLESCLLTRHIEFKATAKMLVLLSPAKSMCSFRASSYLASCPVLLEKTDTLLKVMKGKSKADIKVIEKSRLLHQRHQPPLSETKAFFNFFQFFLH